MLLTTSLVLLLADTIATPLDSWVPRRMAELGIPAVAVSAVSVGHSGWTWWSGIENVLTRHPVSESTVWPVSDAGTGRVSASPHATIAAILPPGLIVATVWAGLLWVLLIPLSLLVRQRWRFGRWHEIIAILLAAPITWIHLNRLTGPVLAAFFTGLGTAALLIPLFGAVIAWRKSRVSALLFVAAAAGVVWSARNLQLPIPTSGASDAGATVTGLGNYLVSALESDSLELTRKGFTLDGSRWIRYEGRRGTHTFFVLVPARGTGVVAVANAGESESLLREIVDSITR